jgi:predicted glycoside hydrolase/deacetylase ChbG (UPF0249 family)
LRDGRFLSLGNCLAASHLRRFDASSLTAEVTAQLDAFVRAFGRAPDFVDGHQHVHLFPQIRDAVLRRVASAVPGAWVRQCGRSGPLRRRFADRKGLLLDILSGSFRDRAARLGLATNAAFAGTYDFDAAADFASLLPTFLASLPDRGLMMCHPGIVDEQLQRLDPLTGLREREYAVLAGAALPRLLASCGVTLM